MGSAVCLFASLVWDAVFPCPFSIYWRRLGRPPTRNAAHVSSRFSPLEVVTATCNLIVTLWKKRTILCFRVKLSISTCSTVYCLVEPARSSTGVRAVRSCQFRRPGSMYPCFWISWDPLNFTTYGICGIRLFEVFPGAHLKLRGVFFCSGPTAARAALRVTCLTRFPRVACSADDHVGDDLTVYIFFGGSSALLGHLQVLNFKRSHVCIDTRD